MGLYWIFCLFKECSELLCLFFHETTEGSVIDLEAILPIQEHQLYKQWLAVPSSSCWIKSGKQITRRRTDAQKGQRVHETISQTMVAKGMPVIKVPYLIDPLKIFLCLYLNSSSYRVLFPWMIIQQFVYPFLYWWILGAFPVFDSHEYSCCEQSCIKLLQTCYFIPLD